MPRIPIRCLFNQTRPRWETEGRCQCRVPRALDKLTETCRSQQSHSSPPQWAMELTALGKNELEIHTDKPFLSYCLVGKKGMKEYLGTDSIYIKC